MRENAFHKFGFPWEIITYQGIQFTSSLIQSERRCWSRKRFDVQLEHVQAGFRGYQLAEQNLYFFPTALPPVQDPATDQQLAAIHHGLYQRNPKIACRPSTGGQPNA